MTSTIARDVRYIPLVSVDNDGQPCERCDLVDAVISRTVHGVIDGETVALDCCAGCESVTIDQCDPLCTVVVHVSDLAEGYDDRMSGPDDTRPHPDGA